MNDKLTPWVTKDDLVEMKLELLSELKDIINPQTEERFYTRKATAKLLNVSQSTLSRWAKDKILSPIYIGGTCKYRKSDIDDLIRKGTTT